MLLSEQDAQILSAYMDAVNECASWPEIEKRLIGAGFSNVEEQIVGIEDMLKNG